MNEVIRIRLLLARFHEDDEPCVIGAIDQTIWDHWDDEEESHWRQTGRELWGADPTDYELREAWAEFSPDDLVRAFAVPVVQGMVPNRDRDRDERDPAKESE